MIGFVAFLSLIYSNSLFMLEYDNIGQLWNVNYFIVMYNQLYLLPKRRHMIKPLAINTTQYIYIYKGG